MLWLTSCDIYLWLEKKLNWVNHLEVGDFHVSQEKSNPRIDITFYSLTNFSGEQHCAQRCHWLLEGMLHYSYRSGGGLCVLSGRWEYCLVSSPLHSVWFLSFFPWFLAHPCTKNSSLSAYSAALNLQSSVFYFRQPSWGSSPDCLGHKMSIWTRCAFLPIPPLVRHVWPTGSYQNISPHLHWRPAFTTTSIPFIAERYPKVTANFQETVLFKLATPLMSMSYRLGL